MSREPLPGERRFGRLTAPALAEYLRAHPDALLLDARDAQRHAQGHLDGAHRLDGRNHERLLLTEPKDRPVVIYCYHGNASQTYARMFVDFGFAQVHDLIGGYEAWENFGARQAAAPPEESQPAHLPEPLAAWLARAGYDGVDARGAHRNTPLMQAAWRGEDAIVDLLLEHGAALAATNADGNTALWLACVHGDPALIARLVRAGVPIDHANDNGATCLMYAASASKPGVVRTLLELGADPALRSLDDFTALDMAASLECLQLLRRATPRVRAA